ncbi:MULTISPECIES: hypothetical protein [Acidianus]|uniref:Uncharacterized protein n=1 Tax=Candidatus Acidianus copahuensis TaxID=1160895 RepID=A0A031LKX6_9CREN|nr:MULTISPECIES: hypothetical protein [Acidianus]EZQ04717.1 hypothetical protein CM19_08350 [Candidatus Acidianus copahuensis]NON63164.1 hypothetical protein [Acidianus sp. RZ1]
MQVYKYEEIYIAGILHSVPGYFQDIVIIYRDGYQWKAISAEKYKPKDSILTRIKEAVQYSVHESDLDNAIEKLRKNGIKIEEAKSFPFPKKLIEGKTKIQAEFD